MSKKKINKELKNYRPKNSITKKRQREKINKVLFVIIAICILASIVSFGVVGKDLYEQHRAVAQVEDIYNSVSGETKKKPKIVDKRTNKDSFATSSSESNSSLDKKTSSDAKSESKNKNDKTKNKRESSWSKASRSFDESYTSSAALEQGIDPNLLRKIDFGKLQRINKDAKKWLYVPGTGINSYVMQENRVGRYYYLWRDINKKLNDYGSLFSPALPKGVEDAHTLIFGHRTYGSFGDVVFAKMPDYYGNRSQALKHRYVYLYYPDRAERWRIYVGKDTRESDPIYQLPLAFNSSDYSYALSRLRKDARYIIGNAPDVNMRTLVLSTCNSSVRLDARYITCFLPDERYYYDSGVLENFSR